MENVFIIDPARCIGCQACVHACAECSTHRGTSMIHLEYINRADTVQTTPQVCMHCENPTCAMVCPADAIKKGTDGVVHTSLKPRCIGCSNCVLACPFGVPKYSAEADQMMKCDMCYDRTSVGKKPMCATVCPSEALYFGPLEEFRARRRGNPVNRFQFGRQSVRTKVMLVMPEPVEPVSRASGVQSRDVPATLDTQLSTRSKQQVKIDVRLGAVTRSKREEVVG